MGYRFSHFALGAAALAPFAGWSTDSRAQTYTVKGIVLSGSAGTLTAGASVVTLTLSPSGSFSPVGYQRSVTAPTYTVTVKCVDGGTAALACTSHAMVAVIHDPGGVVTGSRLSPLQNFTIGNNTQTVLGGPVGSSPATFTLSALTNSATATFRVGFAVPVLTSGATGLSTTRTFSVAVGPSTSSVTSTMSSTMVAIVWRPMALGVTGSLDFGKVVKPVSGTGTFTLTPAGSLSTSGGAIMPGNSHSVPSFTVTGEGGQAFSLTVPASFVMSRSGSSLTVSTSTSFSGTTQSLSGAVNAQGSFPFTVGGELPISATSPSGAYTGNLVVEVQYN